MRYATLVCRVRRLAHSCHGSVDLLVVVLDLAHDRLATLVYFHQLHCRHTRLDRHPWDARGFVVAAVVVEVVEVVAYCWIEMDER
jgi:hypothetical protein